MKGKTSEKQSSHVGKAMHGRTDAVASVIALMLLLAVIATFIGLYSTEYLPSLKEQSEIEKVSEIKEAFMDFSNDIRHIVSEKTPASYGHTIPLGGGDVIMSPEKSSGALGVTDLDAIVNITAGSIAPNPKEPDASAGMVRVKYESSHSFWEGQGYNWQYGFINVTKKGIEVPVDYYTTGDNKFHNDLSAFAKSFIQFDAVGDAGSGKLTSLTIRMANITAGKNAFISGNSVTNLRVDSDTNKAKYDDPDLAFWIVNSTYGGHTEGYLPEFSEFLFDEIYNDLSSFNGTYWNDIPEPEISLNHLGQGYDRIKVDMSGYGSDTDVVIDSVDITVSVS